MIEVVGVSKVYRTNRGEVTALRDVTLTVRNGEVFGIIGPSGAGKSSLLRLINGLERPTAGALRAEGVDLLALDREGLRRWRQQVGMIFQHFNLLGSKTVFDNVALPLRFAGSYRDGEIRARVSELLARFDLAGLATRYPAQLSGGQKQRVGIARALACRPKILLCDEATSSLDPQTTQSVLALLDGVNRELGLTVVLITHEMDVVRSVCDRVAVLDEGQVVEHGNVADVLLFPQTDVTQRMVNEAAHVDEALARRDRAQVAGPVYRLTFRGEATFAPVLGAVARDTGVDYSILSGRVDRIKGVPYGQLTLSLVGGDLKMALGRLAAHGVQVEEQPG